MMPSKYSGAYRWYVVYLLLFIFILSYLDRYLLTLLVEPIKATMGLNDFQIGLLLGPAFSLFHVLVGIPLGWYADRANRKFLLIAGIIVWCAMTTGSGLATTFLMLLIFRLGLGLGFTCHGSLLQLAARLMQFCLSLATLFFQLGQQLLGICQGFGTGILKVLKQAVGQLLEQMQRSGH